MREVIKGDGSDGTAAAKAYLLAHDSLMTQELYEISKADIQFPGSDGIAGVGGLAPPLVEHISPTEDFIPIGAGGRSAPSSAVPIDSTSNPYAATAPLPWGSLVSTSNGGVIQRFTARTLWGLHQPGWLQWDSGGWYDAPGSDNPGARPRSDISRIIAKGVTSGQHGVVDSGSVLVGMISLDGLSVTSLYLVSVVFDGVAHAWSFDLTTAIAAQPGGIAGFDFTRIIFLANMSSSLFLGPDGAHPSISAFSDQGITIEYSTPGTGPTPPAPTLPYICDASSDLTYAGNRYKSAAIKNDGFKSKIGLDVDALQLTWTLRGDEALVSDPDTGETILTILQGFKYGLLEGYWLKWRRAIMPTFGDCDSIGAVSMFRGRIAEVELDRLSAKITVNSITDLFNRQVPQQLIEANNRSMQVGPGLPPDLNPDPTHWIAMQCVTGEGGSLTRIVAEQTGPTSGVVYAPGTFDMGYLWFQASPFADLIAQVRHYEVTSDGYNVFELFRPLYIDPHAYGSTFVAFVPVPKDQDASGSSLVELKGFPWVPLPEQAV